MLCIVGSGVSAISLSAHVVRVRVMGNVVALEEWKSASEVDDATGAAPPEAPLAAPVVASLSADISEQWSWAATNSRLPQIADLTVSLTAAVDDASIVGEIADGEEVFGRATLYSGPLAAGARHWRRAWIPLSTRAMATVDERRSAECVIRLQDGHGRVLAEARSSVDLQPRDLWLWGGDPRLAAAIERLRAELAEVEARIGEPSDPAESEDLARTRAELVNELRFSAGVRPTLSKSLLAAFVRPNHPEIAKIAEEASLIRSSRGAPAAFSAFQKEDPLVAARDADLTVDVIYEALAARGITYSEPPPGWDYSTAGQRVRDHGRVSRAGLGTCMDTTVLLAAALEHVGLLPILVLVPGHIFVGYWRRNPFPNDPSASSPDWYTATPAIRDPREILEHLQLDRIGLIETTTLARGADVAPARAREIAAEALRDTLPTGGVWLVDVIAARKAGVSALPTVSERPDGVIEVIEYRPGGVAQRSETRREAALSAETTSRLTDPHPPRYRTWKAALFSLNARNALLNLGSGPSVQPLVLPAEGLGELEDRLHQDVEFTLSSGHAVPDVYRARDIVNADQMEPAEQLGFLNDRKIFIQRISTARSSAGPISPAKFTSEIRSMARRAKEARDERGMNPLFLCIGMLRWSHKPGDYADAPIILVPVKIVQRRGGFSLSLDTTASTTPNAALIEWLRREHELEIPSLAEPAADRAGIDVDGVLADVRTAIAERGLSLDVRSEAKLALLDLAAFRMWQDLNIHGDAFVQHPLIDHLVHTPIEAFVDPTVATGGTESADELEALETPIPADATQKQAVLWAREGRTFVLQGPPGTGKSQTITNMVAECMLAGKRVLFVAEKGTALSVVQRRLDAIGLAPFTLNLHHEGSSTTQVRAQLKAALSTRVAPDAAAMDSARRRLRNARYELGQYPERLHRTNAAGLSAYSARDALLVLGDGPEIDVPRDLVSRRADDIAAVRAVLEDLQPLTGAAGVRADHPWRLAGDTAVGGLDVDGISQAVQAAIAGAQWAAGAPDALRRLLDEVTEPDQFTTLARLASSQLPTGDTLAAVLGPEWERSTAEAIDGAEAAVLGWMPHLGGFAPDVLTLPLREIADGLQQASDSGFFGRGKREDAAIAPLRPFAPAGFEFTPQRTSAALTQLVQIQDVHHAVAAHMDVLPGLAPASGWNPFHAGAFDGIRAQRAALVSLTQGLRASSTWDAAARALAASGDLRPEESRLVGLASAWVALRDALGVTSRSAQIWRGDAIGLLEATRRHQDVWHRDATTERLLSLQRWLALTTALAPLHAAGLDDVGDQILDGRLRADYVEDALERGIARASLAERVGAEGLDLFDSETHDERVKSYSAAEAEARRQWVTTGPAQMLDARGAGGQGVGTGGLARELEKTRQKLGTRAILRRFGDAVQELTPLVLCSPSSAVDLIEPGTMEFDLVIFDEASQITVPEAIGTIARAKAVVVVGDSKQMPPSRRIGAQSAVEEELEDDVDEIVEDQESILSECELARVPMLQLSWHYRSQDESLIAFSNSAYYEGGLSSFPTPTLMSSVTGVEFRPVGGAFIRTSSRDTLDVGYGVTAARGTNPQEALAILDTVRALLDVDVPPTVGIVTFNEQQKQLIDDLLHAVKDREPAIARALDESVMGPSDVLFVKALEQVQGDERDVILFSVAFSEQNGKVPLNFGPLSNAGGERRLNVAVTRARRKNIVFCSFDPERLDADSASFRGVKDLKEFLRFAKASGRTDEVAVSGRRTLRDRHRDEVAEALHAAGLHVMADVGMSDFRLDLVLARPESPDRPILPVLLDGEAWKSRGTVSDRDVLPVDVLTGLMDWPAVARIWWPMWLQNRDEVVARIIREVDAAEALLDARAVVDSAPALDQTTDAAPLAPPGDTEPAPLVAEAPLRSFAPAPAAEEAESETVPVAPSLQKIDDTAPAPAAPEASTIVAPLPATPPPPPAAPAGRSVFVPAHTDIVGPRETLDHLSERRPAAAVRAQLVDIIEAEGPVEVARLIRMAARRFGLNQVRTARVEEIRRLVPRGVVRRGPLGSFAWPENLDPEGWRGFRSVDDPPTRSLEEVAPEEIANAMRSVLADAPAVDVETLIRRTAEIFGISRLGANVRARLEAVEALLRAGEEDE